MFEFLKTAARPMTETIKPWESVRRFVKPGIRLSKLGLLKLRKAVPYLRAGLAGVKEEGPRTVTEHKRRHGLAALKLTLTGAQAATAGFPIRVGAGSVRAKRNTRRAGANVAERGRR